MKLIYLVAAGAAALLGACNGAAPTDGAAGGKYIEAPTAADASPVVTASDGPIMLTPKAPGADFPDATITKWQYLGGKFDYDYAADTYKLGEQSPEAGSTMCANSGKGQHIHLIVDNQPYVAKYEPDFAYDMPDGEHYVLTFLSRSYHESIKTEAARRAAVVSVADGAFAREKPINDPMLFYSRPKGTYTGEDAENILLDFYPLNVELGDDYGVKVEVGGQSFTVNEWQPYLLKGLPMGENTVTLTLVDGEGRRVEAPFNPVSRTFTLAADPLN